MKSCKVYNSIDDTNDNCKYAEYQGRYQVCSVVLVHSINYSQEPSNIDQGPDDAPDHVAATNVNNDSNGIDGPEDDEEIGRVLDTEVEVKHEAELL